MEGRSGHKSHDKESLGYLGHHGVMSLGQRVACLILCLPFQMSFKDDAHREQ